MYEIAQKSDKIAEGIVFLAKSLGFRATCKKREKKCYKPNGEIVPGMYNIMTISGENLKNIPLLLDYKKANSNPNKNRLLTKITVKEHGVGEYVGFQIKGDGRLLAPDLQFGTIQHNQTPHCVQSITSHENYSSNNRKNIVLYFLVK